MPIDESGRLVGLLEPGDLEIPEFSNGSGPSLLRSFLQQFEATLDPTHLDAIDERRLVGALVNGFRVLSWRRRREILVEVKVHENSTLPAKTTHIDVVMPDQPFVIDTCEHLFEFRGHLLASSQFAAFTAVRNRNGMLLSLTDRSEKSKAEIFAHFELEGELDSVEIENLREDLLRRLKIARVVVLDFRKMKSQVRELARNYRRSLQKDSDSGYPPALVTETRRLVEWLLNENFVFIGLTRYQKIENGAPVVEEESELGYTTILPEDQFDAAKLIETRLDTEEASSLSVAFKGQEEALIHRSGKIDHFLFHTFNDEGIAVGYIHLRGLFTFKAIQTLGEQIPVVRQRLKEQLAAQDLPEGTLRAKSYANAFNSIPVEFLMQASDESLDSIVKTIQLVDRTRELKSLLVLDTDRRRGLYFLVIPREGYSEELRGRIESILFQSIGATYSDSRVNLGKHDTVLVSFFFTSTEVLQEIDKDILDKKVRDVAGTWQERLHRHLVQSLGGEEAETLYQKYRRAFPEGYQLLHSPDEAISDIEQLERIGGDGDPELAFGILRSEVDRARNSARLRIYLHHNIYLSMILPVLDNFGFQVVDQAVFPVTPLTGEHLHVHTFQIAQVDSDEHPLVIRREVVIEALEAAFAGIINNDPLNKLVTEVGLNWKDVDLLRASVHFLQQLRVATTIIFATNTFCQHPTIAHLLFDFYKARFDPSLRLDPVERDQRCEEIEEEFGRLLTDVPSSAQDTFLRRLLTLWKATVRTSRFQDRSSREHLIAFKLDSSLLPAGSEPRPWREIYVHHAEMAGIHLRGGKLARGGIRWSDRVSDFRQEVLGLQRTQMVKNVLIVPVGAKGGFILRRPDPDPLERRLQADRLYRTFIGALLDLTDNFVEGKIRQPAQTICHDDDDPYLVVAADKGTAHLSDVANQVSFEHQFWLGDAFASGGSVGYDHKALGITARGAWEGVRHHFRELKMNPDLDPITVAGVGDMSGDVFGNAMLLSRKIQLMAAFNHQHIFIDPDPDPEVSFEERMRLFQMKRSSWTDYSTEALSSAGGIYERSSKAISLDPEASNLLGLPMSPHTPEEVIVAILKLPVDLLFNGGIGTFIRDSDESDLDAGDPLNDGIRVPATKVRARVIVEGGNLGVTQRGRIKFAMRGGKINTDFVDNSAGVDCSDHEVNIKTLLASPEISRGLSEEDRRRHLFKARDEVCEMVLQNNRSQSLLISLDEIRSREDLFAFERLIKVLEDRGFLDRERQALPSLDTLARRQTQGVGMSRPELAVLAAYSKMDVYQRLLELPLDLIPRAGQLLNAYFPSEIRERFSEGIDTHHFRREIAMTSLTNHIVDRAGASFFVEMERETGRSVLAIARAYLIAGDLLGAEALYEKVIEPGAFSNVAGIYKALLRISVSIRRSVAWLLGGRGNERVEQIEEFLEERPEAIGEYASCLPDVLTGPEKRRYSSVSEKFMIAGCDRGVAQSLARFDYLAAGVRILDISHSSEIPVAEVARLYYRLGHKSYIHPFVRRCDETVLAGRWDSLSMGILRNKILDGLWALVTRICHDGKKVTHKRWAEVAINELRGKEEFQSIEHEVRILAAEEITIASLQVLSVRFERFLR